MHSAAALERFEQYIEALLSLYCGEDSERLVDALVEQHRFQFNPENIDMTDTTEKPMFKIYTQPSKKAAVNVQIQKGSVLDIPKKIAFGVGNKRQKYTDWIQSSLGGTDGDDAQKRLNALAEIFDQGQERGAIALHYYDKNLSWVVDVIAKFLRENKKTLEAIIPYLKQGMSMKEKSIDEMNDEEKALLNNSGKKTLADLPTNDREQITNLLKQELGEDQFDENKPQPVLPVKMSDEVKALIGKEHAVHSMEEGNVGHVYHNGFVITPYLKAGETVDLLALAKTMLTGQPGQEQKQPSFIRTATVNSILVKAGSDEFFLSRTTERVEAGITDFDFSIKGYTQVEFDNKLYLFGSSFSSKETQEIVALKADCFSSTVVSLDFTEDDQYRFTVKAGEIRLVGEDGTVIETPESLQEFVKSAQVTAYALEVSLGYEQEDQGEAIERMLNGGMSTQELKARADANATDTVEKNWQQYKQEHPEVFANNTEDVDVNETLAQDWKDSQQ